MKQEKISIIIPTLNEEGNIRSLVERIDFALKEDNKIYEIIFVDDNSEDNTRSEVEELFPMYPVSFYLKKGKKGKAQSLLVGFKYAKYDLVAILDGDLQYPPEALPEMVKKVEEGFDIVIAERSKQSVGLERKILNRGFSFFFSNVLHGLDFDVQSGMKMFKKKILEDFTLDPTPWTFDMEFLVKARYYGYSIGSIDIEFSKRRSGKSKIVFLKAIFEIGFNAIKLKFKKMPPLLIAPRKKSSMIGAGVAFSGVRFITHTTLNYNFSAARTFVPWQRNFIIAAALMLLFGLFVYPIYTGVVLVAVLSSIYFFDTLFNLYLALKSLKNPPEIKSAPEELAALRDDSLPVYTILCPLYKEAHMLPGFLEAMCNIEWPKNKLDIMLLLEENDKATIASARSMNLPSYVRILEVPDSLPKTKPKACNYGLSFARGEYVVIYDAEDIPDPLQLKKAFLGFQKVPANVGCLQAKLNYFNPNQNLLTRLFTTEYSLWFDMILPGLQSINTSIPLGGTSNHFRTKDLLILEGWDPFNVTEDCDLGVRIFKKGYTTTIIDSVTLEEANSDLKNWLRQRSRWIKGYIQTYLIHMRRPSAFARETGIHYFIFQLVVGGKTAFVIINPILWMATFSYFAFYPIVGATIEKLYPPVIFYMAAFALVFGNFMAVYYYMLGCAKRGQWSLIKYVFLVPFYWAMMSAASLIAVWQLFAKPHFWEKTNHGLNLKKSLNEEKIVEEEKQAEINKPEDVPAREPELIPEFPLIAQKSLPLAESQANKAGIFEALNKKITALRPKNGLLGMIFSDKGLFVFAILVSNAFNFIFNAFLGRVLTFETLALVTFVNTLWYVASIFIGTFSSTINHRTAYLSAVGNNGLSAQFLSSMINKGLKIIAPLSIVWILAVPFLSGFFNIEDYKVLYFFTPVLVFSLVSYANSGFLNGILSFGSVAIILLAESFTKLVLTGILFYAGLEEWIYLSIIASILFSSLVSMVIIRWKSVKIEKKEEFAFPKRFFAFSLLTNISSVLFLSLDIILVKHFLPPALAGEYMLLSLVGKMVYFFGSIPNMFTFSFVSRKIGLRQDPEGTFQSIYLSSFILVFASFIVLGVFGATTIPFLFGDKSLNILPFVRIYAITIVFFTMANIIVTYQLAKKNYYFAICSIFSSVAMGIGIILYHESIEMVVTAVFWASIGGWLLVESLHYFESRIRFLQRGFADFAEVFNGQPFYNRVMPESAKKILIFNWRDTRHKFAGGAEVYVHELAKNWASDGHKVTIFCGNDNASPRNEIIDDVEIIRRGGFYLVYAWAFLYYMVRFRGKYDVIIDCQNGIPFFTPFYAKEKVYCLMHHVHQEVFRRSLSKPLAFLAMILEKNIMPFVYKKVPFITVSESSMREIKALGMGGEGIEVVNPGINLKNLFPEEKSEQPIVLYLGRLKAYKSIDVLLEAFGAVIKQKPNAKLIIAGSGEESANLKKLARKLHLGGEQVEFIGKVSDRKKVLLLQKAWVLVNPSFMEGWGIVTIEANACGTPVVASDVSGLCDSVMNGKTGFLVEYGNSAALSEHILKIINDKDLRDRMSVNARSWAENFDWRKSSDLFFKIIQRHPVHATEQARF